MGRVGSCGRVCLGLYASPWASLSLPLPSSGVVVPYFFPCCHCHSYHTEPDQVGTGVLGEDFAFHGRGARDTRPDSGSSVECMFSFFTPRPSSFASVSARLASLLQRTDGWIGGWFRESSEYYSTHSLGSLATPSKHSQDCSSTAEDLEYHSLYRTDAR